MNHNTNNYFSFDIHNFTEKISTVDYITTQFQYLKTMLAATRVWLTYGPFLKTCSSNVENLVPVRLVSLISYKHKRFFQ